MESDAMHHLLPFLQLAIRALNELRLRAHRVVIPRPRERPPELRNLPRRLIDGDNVPTLHLLLPQRLDHLRPQVVHRLHLRRLQRQLPGLRRRTGHRRAVDLDLHDLALDHFGFLLDPHPDGLPERLHEGLGLGHLEGEELAAGEHGEGGLEAEGLGHAHGDGGLAGAGLAGEEDGAAGYLAVPDHLEDDAGGLAGGGLADHALGDGAGLEGGVEAQATDVGVGADALDSGQVPGLRQLHLRHGNRETRARV